MPPETHQDGRRTIADLVDALNAIASPEAVLDDPGTSGADPALDSWSGDFLPLPHGGAVARSDIRPCMCPGGPGCRALDEHRHDGPCGVRSFFVTRYVSVVIDPEALAGQAQRSIVDSRVVCPRCVQARPGEVPTHKLDATTGILTALVSVVLTGDPHTSTLGSSSPLPSRPQERT